MGLWRGTVHSYFLLLLSKERQKGQYLFLVFPNSHNPRRGFSSILSTERAVEPLLALASVAMLPTHCCTFPAFTSCICYDAQVLSPSGRTAGSKGAAGRLVGHTEGGVGEESGRGDKEVGWEWEKGSRDERGKWEMN